MGFGKGLDYDCHIFFMAVGKLIGIYTTRVGIEAFRSSVPRAKCEITSPLDFDSRVTIDLRLNRGINLPTDLEILPICHKMGRQ